VLEARLKGDKEARGQTVEQVAEDAKKKKKKVKAGDIPAVKLDDATIHEYNDILAKIDNYDGPGLTKIFKDHDIRNPASGNTFGDVYTSNVRRIKEQARMGTNSVAHVWCFYRCSKSSSKIFSYIKPSMTNSPIGVSQA
jgi:hypothetical protein